MILQFCTKYIMLQTTLIYIHKSFKEKFFFLFGGKGEIMPHHINMWLWSRDCIMYFQYNKKSICICKIMCSFPIHKGTISFLFYFFKKNFLQSPYCWTLWKHSKMMQNLWLTGRIVNFNATHFVIVAMLSVAVDVLVEFDYDAEQEDELTIKVGDVIRNVQMSEGGWWEGELNGKKGMFPDNFVKVS